MAVACANQVARCTADPCLAGSFAIPARVRVRGADARSGDTAEPPPAGTGAPPATPEGEAVRDVAARAGAA